MDIYFSGDTSIKLKGKKTTIVIDPRDDKEADAMLITSSTVPAVKAVNARVKIAGPGEYEVGGVSVVGTQVDNTTVYRIKMDGMVLLHVGFLKKALSEAEVDRIAATDIDIVFVPVGGGDVLSGKDATETITKIQPKIVVPMHFTPDSIAAFLKEIGKEGVSSQPKLTTTREKLPQELEVVWLT